MDLSGVRKKNALHKRGEETRSGGTEEGLVGGYTNIRSHIPQ